MKNRYRIIYVGDDSLNHRTFLWAKDHDEAMRKMQRKGVDYILSIRKTANPLIAGGIVLASLAALLLILALHH